MHIRSLTASSGSCELEYGDPSGANAAVFGEPAYYALPGTASVADTEVPVVGSVSLPAGSYDVVAVCEQSSGSGGVAYEGTLNVVGVATH